MSKELSSLSGALKTHDDKLVFKMHSNKTNFSRNTSRVCPICRSDAQDKHLSTCSACKRIWYCSPTCQKEDWKRHRPICKMHREQQAAMDRADLNSRGTNSEMPSLSMVRDMLEDFANLHHRGLSVAAGHEFGLRGNTFPPLDIKKDCIAATLKLRDPKASPASVFEFSGGILPCPISSLDAEKQQALAVYAERLSQINSDANSICFVPILYTVQKPPVLLITVIDIMRDQLDLNLLKKTVPNDAPWWTQLEYNAQRGLVIRRRWNARLQTFVELLGTMEQKDDCWKWEKAGDSRGNEAAKEILRERKKMLQK